MENLPLPDIDHVIVLMLENRSFDNMFGGLYPQSEKFYGLKGDESNPNPTQPSEKITVWQACVSGQATVIPNPDPGENFDDMNYQLFGTFTPKETCKPTMDGFVANYAQQKPTKPIDPFEKPVYPKPCNIMQFFQEGNIPTSYELARMYGVSDLWFASAPVQTLSNRTFVHTGTPSMMACSNGGTCSRVNNGDYTSGLSFEKIITKGFQPPVEDITIFKMLDNKYPEGKSTCGEVSGRLNWKVYYHDAPLSALCKDVYDKWCFDHLEGGNVYQYYDSKTQTNNFEYDIEHGLLPKYSFIEPSYTSLPLLWTANSNHPGGSIPDPIDLNAKNFQPPIDVANGENLLAEIYQILTKYPNVFARTLFIVTYDEHGGLYDHWPPGEAVSPFSNPVSNFNYNRYGVRVPTILINPRIGPNAVFRPSDGIPQSGVCGRFTTQLDHTSIIKTLCQQFQLDDPPTPRAKLAATLKGVVRPLNKDESDFDIAWDVVATGAASAANRRKTPHKLGDSLRIRNWFFKRTVDSFDGDHLNNAVIATFACAWFGNLRRSVYPLLELPDLEPEIGVKLRDLGIFNTKKLQSALSADSGIDRIANYLNIDPLRALRWKQQIDLLRVPGISGDDAYLLVSAGICSVEELSSANSNEVRHSIEVVMKQFGIKEVLPQDEINRWISSTRKIM